MPRDLFEQQGPRDLFETSGITPRDYSTWQGLYGGAATTAKRGILGIEQMLANAMYEGEELRALKDELARRNAMNESEYAAISQSAPISSFGGSVLGASALLAPTFAIPGGAPVAGAGILKGIAIPLAARGAAEGAFLGGLNYVPEGQSRLENTAMGAALGGATAGTLGASLGLGAKGYNALRDVELWDIARRFRGELPAEDILKNLKAAEGTETPLGRIIENPFLMRLEENTLSRIPGSGFAQSQQRIAQNLRGQTEDILSQFGQARLPEDMTLEQALHQNLYKGTSGARAKNSELYSNVREIAESNGVDVVPNTNEYGVAKSILEKASKDKRLAKALDEDQILRDELLRIVQGEGRVMNPATGQMTSVPIKRDFMNAHYDRSKYLESERALNWDDRLIKNVYLDLSKAMTKDMDAAARNSGVPELMKAYKKATDDYKRHVLPLTTNKKLAQTQKRLPGLEGQEVMFAEEVSEKLPGMILGGGKRNDYVASINSFMKYLDDEGKNLLLQSHFRKALDENGNVIPSAFLNSWNSLGPRQKQKLFSHIPGTVERFEELSRLAKLNPKAFQTMFNPPTGQQAVDPLLASQLIGGGFGIGASAGGIFGGILGSAAAIPAASLIAKKATQLLTSEKVRKHIVEQLLKEPKAKRKMSETERYIDLINEVSKSAGRVSVENKKQKIEGE